MPSVDLEGRILLTRLRSLEERAVDFDLATDPTASKRQGHSALGADAPIPAWPCGRRFRPNWQDLGRVYVVSALYLAMVIPVNLEFSMNFGFLGNPPPARIPPFIDALGAWPLRALIVVALAAAGFAILVLPWRLVTLSWRTSKLHKST